MRGLLDMAMCTSSPDRTSVPYKTRIEVSVLDILQACVSLAMVDLQQLNNAFVVVRLDSGFWHKSFAAPPLLGSAILPW